MQRQYVKNGEFRIAYYVLRFREVLSHLFRIYRRQYKS
jgi:hypothetical protein